MADQLEQPAQVADSTPAPAEPTETSAASETTVTQPVEGQETTPTPDDATELASLLPADDGLEEIEHDGIKAKVPKELKEAFMRHRDYTQKTQEVAEARRQIEAQAAEFQRQVQFQQQVQDEYATLKSMERSIAEYQRLDWATLIVQNPQQAQLLDMQRRELQGQHAQLASNLAQRQQQQALMEQQATARRIQEGQQELARDIKGWSPELANKLTDYARKAGFPAEVLARVSQPAFVKTVHKAYLYDQLVAQRNAKSPATPAQPSAKVGARASTATLNPDNLSGDEWRKWRESQLEARRKKR